MSSVAPDVVVVGGGVVGCSAALALVAEGVEVMVLERSIPGAEASSSAAGMLAAQVEAEAPGPLLDLCLESRRRWPRFAARLEEVSGVGVSLREDGILMPAFSRSELESLGARAQWQKGNGHRVEVLSSAEVRSLEPGLSEDVVGGLLFPDGAQVYPPALIRALHGTAERMGATFRSGTTVQSLLSADGKIRGVELSSGERIMCPWVVVAGGAWSSLVGGVGLPGGSLRPLRGQMMALRPRMRTPNRPIFGHGLGYVVPAADGDVWVGSTVEAVGFDRSVTVAGLAHLAKVAARLIPTLAASPVHRTWAGLRPGTEDDLPLLGVGPLDGLVIAAGHFRNGILLTPVSGDIVADLVQGRAPAVDLDPFSPRRIGGL